ncbi:MAG: hypothetical protein O7C63_05990 [Alphaproteobacteria bacterium]|nr:hypothetical protein [Alphaproteobacteria bacterium]
MTDLVGHSFMQVHQSPFLYIVNGLSYIVPMSQEAFYAATMGVLHAAFVPAFCFFFFRMVRGGSGSASERAWQLSLWAALGGGIAFAYAMNGMVMNALWLGHYEFSIPLFTILVFAALAAGRPWLAAVVLTVAVTQREDAGFHLFSMLFLWTGYLAYVRRRPLRTLKLEIGLTVASLVSGAILYIMIAPLINAIDATQAIFTGDRPFAHVTVDRLVEVLTLHRQRSGHLYWPALVVVCAALIRRRPVYLIGLLAVIPWTILHWTAYHLDSAYLYSYKAFPFMVVYLWPLMAEVLDPPSAAGPARPARAAARPNPAVTTAIIAAVIGASFFPLNRDGNWFYPSWRPFGATVHACAAQRKGYDFVREALARDRDQLGSVRVSPGVARLGWGTIEAREVIKWRGAPDGGPLIETGLDTVIFYANGLAFEAAKALAEGNGLEHLHVFQGTALIIASNTAPTGNHFAASLLRPVTWETVRDQCRL